MKISKRPGNIVAIPLPNGKFGFACLFHHGLTGVYQHTSESPNEIPIDRRFMFMTGIVTPVMNSSKWPIVGKDVIAKESKTLLPLQYIRDEDSGTYSTYVAATGERAISSKTACQGLEKVAAWSEQHVIDRIMNDGRNSWLGNGDSQPWGIEYDDKGKFRRFDLETGAWK